HFFFTIRPSPSISTLFPYTTLFRSHCAADEYWRMVPQKSSPSPEAGSCRSGTPSLAWFRPSSCGSIQPANRLEPRDSRGADVFQVLLSRKLDELLHVLPDEQIPPHGSECAIASVSVSGRGG